jgi:hypothetical protein
MSAQREVYATIWCGSAATAYFSGFQVLLHSIRQHDEHRPIVVLMDGATNCTPTADGPLLDDIAERHAPLIFKHSSSMSMFLCGTSTASEVCVGLESMGVESLHARG